MIVVVRWCILFFFVSVCFIFIFCFAEKKSHRENLMKKACKVEFQPFNRSHSQLTYKKTKEKTGTSWPHYNLSPHFVRPV